MPSTSVYFRIAQDVSWQAGQSWMSEGVLVARCCVCDRLAMRNGPCHYLSVLSVKVQRLRGNHVRYNHDCGMFHDVMMCYVQVR